MVEIAVGRPGVNFAVLCVSPVVAVEGDVVFHVAITKVVKVFVAYAPPVAYQAYYLFVSFLCVVGIAQVDVLA